MRLQEDEIMGGQWKNLTIINKTDVISKINSQLKWLPKSRLLLKYLWKCLTENRLLRDRIDGKLQGIYI